MKRIIGVLTAAAMALAFAACDNPAGVEPEPDRYGISVSVNGDAVNTTAGLVFGDAGQDYTPITPLTVTITNNGNKPTGELTIALETGAGSFTLTKNTIGTNGTGGTDTFTVGPNDGLGMGTYEATITITGGNGISVSFPVKFRVIAPYSIELDKNGTHTFPNVILDADGNYAEITPLTVTVTNNGSNPTGELTIALETGAGSFTLNKASIGNIETGGTGTFIVGPNDNLPAGTYTATVTVSGENEITASLGLSFTVMEPFTTIEAVTNYLLYQVEGGTTPNNPVFLPVNLETGNWPALLSVIQTAGKYVALDISAGAMMGVGTDTEFDPGTADTGKRFIVSLVLPDAALSIKAGSASPDIPSFIYFTALREVTGAKIETIGVFAFIHCTSLTTLDFPAAVTIDNYVFYGCTSLTTLDLPAAKTIGFEAFRYSTGLITINLPVVETIGNEAFQGCTSLSEMNLPASLTSIGRNPFMYCVNLTTITVNSGNQHFKAQNDMLLNKAGTTLIAYPGASGAVTVPGITSIGEYAFAGCTSLTTLNLPAAKTLGEGAFGECTALQTVSLPAAETIGEYAFAVCTGLTTLNLPAAKTIGGMAFSGCTDLETVSLPVVETIGNNAFDGCTGLTTVNLGAEAPDLGYGMFYNINEAKTVTVKVPSTVPPTGSGYGPIPAFYTGNDTAETWGNGFRGRGWDGSAFIDSDEIYTDSNVINSNITLVIRYEGN
jgi:hypothetical protein